MSCGRRGRSRSGCGWRAAASGARGRSPSTSTVPSLGDPQPEDRLEQLAPARSDEPCEPDDLARADVEVDVCEERPARRVRAREAQAVHRSSSTRDPSSAASPPRARGRPSCGSALARVSSAVVLSPTLSAVPQHGDAIGQLEDLVDPMRDEDRRDTVVAKLPHHCEERLDLVVGEGAGRLVEDQDSARRSRAHARSRPSAAGRAGAGGRAATGRGRARAARSPRAPARASSSSPRAAAHRHPVPEEDVLCDREVGRERRLLRHRRDALAQRIRRSPERGRPARELDGSGVGLRSGPRGSAATWTCPSRSRPSARAPRRGGR